VSEQQMMRSANPATEEQIASYPVTTAAEVEAALDRAAAPRPGWRAMRTEDRCRLVAAAGAILRDRCDQMAALITAEMGKPLAEARAAARVLTASHDDPLADEASVTAMLGAAYTGRRPVP
jgi:acyl-CoA reductase-like NAD-dependent aldehyde dehydrogenase